MRPGRMAAAVLAMVVTAAALAGAGPDGYFGSGNDEAELTTARAATA